MAGLAPPTIRQPGSEEVEVDPADVIVIVDEDPVDKPEYDEKGNILKIEHGDGSITVSLDGRPIERGPDNDNDEWFANLADEIPQDELGRISGELMRGIEADLTSRREWVDNRVSGLKLLGLKIEVPNLGGGADGAPMEGMSKVRHPLLLEAVLRFQANARAELLPTDGPVKVRVDESMDGINTDLLANAYEKDLNHYLTAVATEYYPDTDRMLLMLGFGGTSFKKVYFCPLRSRPVSESVDANDLIVSENATDLMNALRVTHRSFMKPSTVKRLQILGVYRDIPLNDPTPPKLDEVREQQKDIQGVSSSSMNPNDRDREIYECYCELEIKGFEHRHKNKDTGLELPYRVTIDVSTREILSIVRNYDEDTKDLPIARKNFVKYTFVPGLGFYDIGLVHILGNTTNAVTAAWREMLDAGMYANFPGFLVSKIAGRQQTNIFRIPPGGGAPVETGGMPINQAVMALPYKDPSQALMSLVQNMAETGMRVGGTSEQAVGEGRADAPVGTTLALIEQATKVLNSVHKRMHAAQAEEFQLLSACFAEHPESFWERNKQPSYKWDKTTFEMALHNCTLVPQADPNTASHSQRVMKIMALKQLEAANPANYDAIAVDTAALKAIGWDNPQQFLIPPEQQKAPPPEVQKVIAETGIKKQVADAKTMDSQAKMVEAQAAAKKVELEGANDGHSATGLGQANLLKAKADVMDAETKQQSLGWQMKSKSIDDQNRDLDRQSKEHIALLNLAKEVALHAQDPQSMGEVKDILDTPLGP